MSRQPHDGLHAAQSAGKSPPIPVATMLGLTHAVANRIARHRESSGGNRHESPNATPQRVHFIVARKYGCRLDDTHGEQNCADY